MEKNEYDLARTAEPARPGAPVATRPRAAEKPPRLTSLDAYRGLVMVVLAGTGFGILKLARTALEQGSENVVLWRTLEYHFSHSQWISQTAVPESIGQVNLNTFGCPAWDLIQPSFMFMVGVAMVYSYAKRKRRGDSRLKTWAHVLIRSLVLVLLGVFLSSQWGHETNWVFFNVLCQIGLGYVFVYLLLDREVQVQLAAAGLILVGYWLTFFLYSLPGPGVDYASAGTAASPAEAEQARAGGGDKALVLCQGKEWGSGWLGLSAANPQFFRTGGSLRSTPATPKSSLDKALAPIADELAMPERFAPWKKNANFAADFDRWLLNKFPRSEPFELNEDGYTTLNFIPSIFTTLLGVMAGQLLRGPRRPIVKFLLLVAGGVVCMALGATAGATVCPVVKRIWTPSWALFSGAYVLWLLAAFYLVCDVVRFRLWAWPLVVVGMNSIAVYVMFQSMRGWTARMLTIHLGPDLMPAPVKDWLATTNGLNLGQDGPYAPVVQSVMVLLVFWLICVWMYRQKIFVRV